MISFVVPAHDEERLLARTLETLHAAADALGEPYDVTVVDDASTDATPTIALAAGVRVVRVAHRQIARARNAGARASTGDLLIFVDADTLVSVEVLRASLDAIRRGAVGGGALFEFDGPLSPWTIVARPIVRWLMTRLHLAAGCYLYVRRDHFEAVGGFDESLFATEEIALSRALRRRGPVVVLPLVVQTSGRKLRSGSGWRLLRLIGSLLRRGPAVVRDRRDLDLWYGPRRHD